MAVLIATNGPAEDQKFSLGAHRLLMIGRDASCSIQISDRRLSRNHLQIRYDEEKDRHFAIDFDSKNGVYVNGQRIEQETELQDRDVIKAGSTAFVYSIDETVDACQVRDIPKKFGEGHVRTVADQPASAFGESDASAEIRKDRAGES